MIKSSNAAVYDAAKELQFESLNNAVINSGIEGLKLHHAFEEDKRKTVPMFYITYNGISISPSKMDYNNCNHFLLGISTMKEKISIF